MGILMMGILVIFPSGGQKVFFKFLINFVLYFVSISPFLVKET